MWPLGSLMRFDKCSFLLAQLDFNVAFGVSNIACCRLPDGSDRLGRRCELGVWPA